MKLRLRVAWMACCRALCCCYMIRPPSPPVPDLFDAVGARKCMGSSEAHAGSDHNLHVIANVREWYNGDALTDVDGLALVTPLAFERSAS